MKKRIEIRPMSGVNVEEEVSEQLRTEREDSQKIIRTLFGAVKVLTRKYIDGVAVAGNVPYMVPSPKKALFEEESKLFDF